MVHFVALATMAPIAAACDEQRDPGCLATGALIGSKLSCPWKVSSDDITVNNPIIRQSNPGRDCDYFQQGLMHLDTRRNNTFSAREGSCQPDNLREHNCDEVKDYFRWQNAWPLKLKEAKLEEEPDTSATLRPVIKDHPAAKALAPGRKLRPSCSVDVQEFHFPKLPAIVEFDCMQCNAATDLMAKCCNECVRFSTSETLANVSMIDAFVVCKGCQTKTINIPWEGGVKQQPWVHAGKYDDYSRKSQEDRMDKWVDKKICSKLAKDTCEDPPRKSGQLLREAAWTTTTTTRESLAEQCRRLGESKNSTTATTIAGASATVVGDNIQKGDNAAPTGTIASGNSSSGSSTGSAAVSVPALMTAVIVAGVVLV